MQITIDNNSGFCFGVTYAIETAERELKEDKTLYCLGDIVHNEMEVNRLKEMGLIIIGQDEFEKLKDCRVLIRAHGEPPETYRTALRNNIRLIDATCPVVLKLQQDIVQGHASTSDKDGQIVIYGKQGHAEVKGLAGQVKGEAIVVSNEEDLSRIDFTRPVRLYAQTTKSVEGFSKISGMIQSRMEEENPGSVPDFLGHDTVCRQVSGRTEKLKEFASRFDVVIFVSGYESSNGLALFRVCQSVNPSTYLVSNVGELKKEWFKGAANAGVCGATSTPAWLMEEVGKAIKSI